MMKTISPSFLVLSLLAVSIGCGGPQRPAGETLSELATAIRTPVMDAQQSDDNSRFVERLVEDGTLQGMRRFEVEEAIGRGEPCSRHARCAEQGFAGNDLFYMVGASGTFSGALPQLIIGFGREGRVNSVWNLRTH